MDLRQQWCTPPALYASLDEEFSFDCDVAANRRNHLHEKWIGKSKNALSPRTKWGKRNFCNPPFNDIDPWVDRAWAEVSDHDALTVMLLPNRMDRPWFLNHVRHAEIRSFVSRVHYVPPVGVKASSPAFTSLLLVFRPVLIFVHRIDFHLCDGGGRILRST